MPLKESEAINKSRSAPRYVIQFRDMCSQITSRPLAAMELEDSHWENVLWIKVILARFTIDTPITQKRSLSEPCSEDNFSEMLYNIIKYHGRGKGKGEGGE